MWDAFVEEAKCLEYTCQEYKKCQRENGDTGSMPSYSNLVLDADAMRPSRGYSKPLVMSMESVFYMQLMQQTWLNWKGDVLCQWNTMQKV